MGSERSGVIVLIDGQISHAENADNAKVYDLISSYKEVGTKLRVAVEDVRPYYGQRLTMQLIDTCKFIGEMRYRLATGRISAKYIPRSAVKRFIYDNYLPSIQNHLLKKLAERGALNQSGDLRKISYQWVDDKMVIEAMRTEWDIPYAGVGKRNRFGISAHSWQALGLATLSLKQ